MTCLGNSLSFECDVKANCFVIYEGLIRKHLLITFKIISVKSASCIMIKLQDLSD